MVQNMQHTVSIFNPFVFQIFPKANSNCTSFDHLSPTIPTDSNIKEEYNSSKKFHLLVLFNFYVLEGRANLEFTKSMI